MSNDLPRPFGPTYTLLKLLARGGMGEIYLARTAGITGFEKYYAVKKLLKKFTHDNDVGARFIDEAKLGARLQHPNIVQVYDLGRVSDELYMATEFVDGFDLRRVLRFCHEKKKRIPLDIALFIVREILSGLAYAHRQVDAEGHSINLIHRDISPQNVLVSFEGEVKIIDFGLAKSTQRSQETQANVLLGNFGYMSPEQARGHVLDVRTDVYSAGIVLFELVTGTKRFVEENPLRLLEMVARPTPIVPSDRVPGTPKTIDRIYLKATAPSKEERFENAEAFRDDVTAALHRINPKASRENLAQFLNHLFLGGVAPAPIDSDALDKSVAIRVQDLHGASDAFQQPVESDIKDRRLHEFAEDAPQTGSHPLMRQARAGDVLTHEQLTGEGGAGVGAAALPVVASPIAQASPPPMDAMSPPTQNNRLPSLGSQEATLTIQAASRGPAPSVSASAIAELSEISDDALQPLDALELDPLEELQPELLQPTPTGAAVLPAIAAPPPVEELEDDLASAGGTPTSIYDSPEWPGELDRAAADAVDVQKQIEAELQRQLEAQAAAQRQLAAQPAAAAPLPQPAPRVAPPSAPPSSRSQNTVVTMVGPPPKRPPPQQQEQPSIVIAMELEPSEPTVVGAPTPMPTPHGDVARTLEVSPVTDQALVGDGFGGGDAHESLIIDFDGGPAPAEQGNASEDKSIRPAAQPLGKRVVPAVAQSRRATNPRAVQVSDEGPTNTMIPPTTRRR